MVLRATPAHAAASNISGGSLDWGAKASFRSYIAGPIAAGSITVTGATTNTDGTFRFAPGSGTYDGATGALNASFTGKVRFIGHDMGDGPLLDVTFDHLRIEISGSAANLVADVDSKSLTSAEVVHYPNLVLATLNMAGIAPSVAGATVTFTNVPVALTAAGVPAFAEFYEAGTALDPLTFSVTIAAAASPTATATATTPAATTTTPAATATAVPATATATTPPVQGSPKITLSKTVVNPAGDTITVTGTGFLPSMAMGTRPPLAGQPAGTYIAFASFAADWKPSAGAPGSARPTDGANLRWAVPEASRDLVGRDASVTLNPDGSFTAVITVRRDYPGALANGNYGIYTFPGSGGVQPLFETFTPVTFSAAPVTATIAPPKPPTTGSGLENSGAISSTGFAAMGAAVATVSAGTLLYVARRKRAVARTS
jgi:hypothetical protein